MKFLLIETASSVCSVATATEEKIISIKENSEAQQHAALVTVFADEVMKESQWEFSELDAVVVSSGPGSYTGLRIGVSAAKGICYAANTPLIAVDTLESLALGFKEFRSNPYNVCSVFDARRDEVYYGIWNEQGNKIVGSRAAILNEEFKNAIESVEGIISFVGDGAAKVREFIYDPCASYHPSFRTSAQFILSPAVEKFQQKDFADVAYFEPNYIKPFYFAEKK